jgi:hypothetical protein
MNKVLLLLVAVAAAMLGVTGSAYAATGFERVGAFNESFPDGQPKHQNRIAVNHDSGDVYVTDVTNDQIAVWRPNGTSADSLTTFGAGDITDPLGIAIDQDTGDVYVSDDNDVVKYTSDGAPTPTFTLDGGFTGPGVTGPLAFDQANDQLLVGDKATNTVRRYSTAGAAGTTFDGSAGAGSPGAFAGIQDLAVDSTGDIIVVDSTGDPALGTGTSRVERHASNGDWEDTIGPVDAAATVAVRPDDDSLVVSGNQDAVARAEKPTLNTFAANGNPLAQVVVDDSAAYATVAGLAVGDGSTGQLFVATDVEAVYGGNLGGLVSVQVYDPFVIQVPTVSGVSASPTEVGARLRASINPNRVETTWQFEYGETASYGKTFPATPATLPAGTTPVDVQRVIGGLEPGRTYHFRLVATNAGGTANGSDQTFTTIEQSPPEGGESGNGRVYEQVTPTEKNGQSPDFRFAMLASPSGDALAYSIPNLPGGPTSTLTAYAVARRSANWSSLSADVPQTTPAALPRVSLVKGFSAGLTRSLTLSERALAPGAIEGGTNFYYKDLRTGEVSLAAAYAGSDLALDLLNTYAPPVPASSTLDNFAIDTDQELSPGSAPGVVNAFEYRGGVFRLAGLVDGVAPADGSYGGPRPHETNDNVQYQMSANGRRLFFMTDTAAFGTVAGGKLWMREDGERTVAISASQRTGEVGEVKRVYFAGATPDGDQVFFKYEGQLTNTSKAGDNLYRYDVSDGTLTDLTATAAQPQVEYVQAVTNDGAVYFTHDGQLGDNDGEEINKLYVADGNGPPRYIGPYARIGLQVSPNGRYASYDTTEAPLGFDNRSEYCFGPFGEPNVPCLEVLVYDRETRVLSCASCQADPINGNRDAVAAPAIGTERRRFTQRPQAVLDDGRVYFETTEVLARADVNGRTDVYEWDPESRRSRLISPGTAPVDAHLTTVTPDGKSVFFTTDQRLVGQDGDDLGDVYVARLTGGLAGQQGAALVRPCSGDDCQGSPSQAPLPTPVASDRPGTHAPAGVARPRSSGGIPTAPQLRSLAAGRAVTIRVSVNRAGSVVVRGRGLVSGRARTLFSASKVSSRAGTVSIRLKLSAITRSELRKKRTLRVSFSVRFGSHTRTRALTLRRAANASTRSRNVSPEPVSTPSRIRGTK